jgi:5-oxoprolinase (ATP-hydrolysing) subunit A
MRRIDLNCDLGESFGAWKMGFDEEVMKYITSANVACGWHGGDPMAMDKTILLAKQQNVGVGAHPGYPDLLGFGRRSIDCTYDELKNYVIYQVGALDGFCKIHGVKMTHVKPHGKMYLDAFDKIHQARAIAEAIVRYNPGLFYVAFAGAKGKLMTEVAKEMKLKVVYEAFPDRAYTAEGDLVSRSQPGAVIKNPQEVAERALLMAKEHKVIAIDGTSIEIDAQTLCVHGDTPTAVDLVKTIREVLKKNGIDVIPMASFI